jgi:hypothetical protein
MDFCVRRWVPRNPVVDVEILVAAGEVPWAAANRSHLHPGPLELLATDISLTYRFRTLER